jgi:hypothetical protein
MEAARVLPVLYAYGHTDVLHGDAAAMAALTEAIDILLQSAAGKGRWTSFVLSMLHGLAVVGGQAVLAHLLGNHGNGEGACKEEGGAHGAGAEKKAGRGVGYLLQVICATWHDHSRYYNVLYPKMALLRLLCAHAV